jgi:hypothetical protein
MVEGLHVDTGGVGGASVTVVLPSGQVTATAQTDCSWPLLAVAVLLILFVFSAVAVELENVNLVPLFRPTALYYGDRKYVTPVLDIGINIICAK